MYIFAELKKNNVFISFTVVTAKITAMNILAEDNENKMWSFE